MSTGFELLNAPRLFLALWMLAAMPLRMAAQTNNPAPPVTLHGVYTSVAGISPAISLRFATNGTYRADIGPCGPLGCFSKSGTWKWDDQGRQFLLSSTQEVWVSGSHPAFEFRRFRVDNQKPDFIEWVPQAGAGNVLGVYERIEFQRQREEP